MSDTVKSTSKIWFLFPILFGIIGGLIMWAKLEQRDPRMAKNGLYLGITLTVLGFLGSLVVISMIPHLGHF